MLNSFHDAMSNPIVEIEDIGKVAIRRSRKARRICIGVKPAKGITVTIPYGVSTTRAIDFVEQKKTWIIKRLQEFKNAGYYNTVLDAKTVYDLCGYKLKLMQHDRPDFRIKIANGIIRILHPYQTAISEDRFQEAIRIGITETLRMEAKRSLPGRVKELANKHGFRYNNVFIKNAQTRWGSCSKKNNINLNLHLMRLPSHLRDYVILHELTHTVHKNHGKEFWMLLNRLTGNARLHERELKKYNIQLF